MLSFIIKRFIKSLLFAAITMYIFSALFNWFGTELNITYYLISYYIVFAAMLFHEIAYKNDNVPPDI